MEDFQKLNLEDVAMFNKKNFPSDKIEVLVGTLNLRNQVTKPFDKLIIDFLTKFSLELNKIKYTSIYKDVKTLSFFCRYQNLIILKKKFYTNQEIRIGQGLIFHVTPSNIPTNFAYSLIFGLLTGNSNIIKVTSKKFEQVTIICQILKKLLRKEKYKKLKNFINIYRYSQEQEFISQELSLKSDARIIWGSDNTVLEIKKLKTKPKTVDVLFPDRYSFCLINSRKFKSLNQKELLNFANKFYNDTFTADQNACSSPHLIVWSGKINQIYKHRFWKTLSNLVKLNYQAPELSAVDKYHKLCSDLIELQNLKSIKIYDNCIYTLKLKKFTNEMENLRGRWGYFYEFETKDINLISKNINRKYQTVTYFGFKKNTLKKFILDNNLKGIDRFVPVGSALDINFIWDGYDLYRSLTRIIEVK